MKLLIFLVVVLCPLAPAANRPSLAARIRVLIENSPVARSAFWGIDAMDMDSGAFLFRWNTDHFFVPASNTKLFTTALALVRLGPDYRTKTTVLATTPPDEQGRIAGDLTLFGGGDANLSGRPIPYDPNAEKSDPLTALSAIAHELYEHGLRIVDGNVIGDDSAWPFEPYGEGWGLDDPVGLDGAPVSALAVNDNAIALHIAPAGLSFDPPLSMFAVDNRLVAGSPRAVHVARQPGSDLVELWGALPPDDPGITINLGVSDPARYAALALLEAMRRQGIAITGKAGARHWFRGTAPPPPPTGVVLASHDSAPLSEDLRVTEKVSQNLHAEMLLRLVGQGSRKAGTEELCRFLDEAGIDRNEYTFRDGSGLSRLNEVTPNAVRELLVYMARSPLASRWLGLFPVAGVDGSLRLRFERSPAKARLVGKTGTLTHVSALSGYVTRSNGHRIAYSIMVNNFNGPSSEIREVIDKIGALLVK